jgi:hypothetical protein
MDSGSSVSARRQSNDGGDSTYREAPPLGRIGDRVEFRCHRSHQIAMTRGREYRHALDDTAERARGNHSARRQIADCPSRQSIAGHESQHATTTAATRSSGTLATISGWNGSTP